MGYLVSILFMLLVMSVIAVLAKDIIKSKIYKLVLLFILVYTLLTTFLIALYFYLGSKYAISLGDANLSNSYPTWSRYDIISIFSGVGVFLAPITVLMGLDAWKSQKYGERKIQIIENMNKALHELYNFVTEYRTQKTGAHLFDSNKNILCENFISGFESYYFALKSEVLLSSLYFQDSTFDKLLELLNNLFDVEQNFYDAFINTHDKSGEKICVKKLYLVSPTHIIIRQESNKNQSFKKELDEYEKDKLFKYFESFFNELDSMLKNEYNL